MDLREFYDQVETVTRDLRQAGHPGEADKVEKALNGGATSGEILGGLSVALRAAAVSVPSMAEDIGGLAEWASAAFRT